MQISSKAFLQKANHMSSLLSYFLRLGYLISKLLLLLLV